MGSRQPLHRVRTEYPQTAPTLTLVRSTDDQDTPGPHGVSSNCHYIHLTAIDRRSRYTGSARCILNLPLHSPYCDRQTIKIHRVRTVYPQTAPTLTVVRSQTIKIHRVRTVYPQTAPTFTLLRSTDDQDTPGPHGVSSNC